VLRSSQLGGVVVSGHADVVRLLRDNDLTSMNTTGTIARLPPEQRESLAPLESSLGRWGGGSERAEHARVQAVLKRYFTPRTVAALRPVAQSILDELLDSLSTDRVDMVSALAYPYPAAVMAHMLGVPSGNLDRVQEWSRHITAVFVHSDYESLLESQRSILAMDDFMRPLVAERREHPTDDILSVLVGAEAEGRLEPEEIVPNCTLLLFAGHETTARLLANGLCALLEHPEQLAALRRDPSLRANAIEEMLRYDGPAGSVVRISSEEYPLGPLTVAAGEPMFVALVGGNHDPEVFEDPDRFDITRPNARKHLAFGTGFFYCLGAALARLEADVFFETLLRRYATIEALERPVWSYTPPLNRGLDRYRVRLAP